jgi:hypothetical protein
MRMGADWARIGTLSRLFFGPHWFRHAHASHADNGAPITLVSQTLGGGKIPIADTWVARTSTTRR